MSIPDPRENPEPLHIRFGDFEVDERNAQLICRGNSLALPPIPFGLLCALLRKPGTLLSKHALLDAVWGHRFVSDSVLKGAISDIRRVLADDPRSPRFIETLPRRGYRFIASVALINAQSSPLVADRSTTSIGSTDNAALTDVQPDAALFIGRQAELKKLRSAWEKALQGNRAMLWIAGEPGIGKSTLIDHFVRELPSVVTLFGQCVQHHGAGEPYLPVLEALAELCRRDQHAADLLRDIAPTWLLQLPWLSNAMQRDALLHELVGANPQRMLREMGEFIDRYTEQQPLLLITEDLQWADQSTIQLIDYLARRRNRRQLMWLSSFRLTEVVALDHPLNTIRHELKPLGLIEEILLDSFSESEVAQYMVSRTPQMAANEAFVRTLHERTGGVPLFVASVARDVSTTEQTDALMQQVATKIPENLSALIDHYIARLNDAQRKLLTAAAVAGMELQPEVLSAVLGCETGELLAHCDDLVRARTWLVLAKQADASDDPVYAYEFRHALYRQRLYDITSTASRADLHLKIAQVLELRRSQGDEVTAAELASHFDLGRSALKALQYYAEAAETALLHLSPAECLNLTEKALKLSDRLPPSPDRLALDITLFTLRGAAAFHAYGAGDDAKSAYLQAAKLVSVNPDHPKAALAMHGLGFLLHLRAEYQEALDVAETALSYGTTNALLVIVASTIKGQVMMIQGNYAQAQAALQQALSALELADAAASQPPAGYIVDPKATVLSMLSLVLCQLGRFAEAATYIQQAYARSQAIAQPMALMVTLWFDALCGIRRADTARVGALANEMQVLVNEYSLAQGKAACHWFLGWTDARCGKPDEGFRRIRDAYEKNRSLGMLSGGSETLGYAAEALVIKGDWQAAQLQLDQAFDIVQSYGEYIYLPQLQLIQAAIAHLRGDAPVEAESLRSAVLTARQQDATWLELLALTAWCERGQPDTADLSALEQLITTVQGAGDINILEQARNILRFAKD